MSHTIDELREKQALPLEIKISLTMARVRAWVHEYGEDGCYISFSGGKDSTVLMDIVRNRMGYNVPAMFVNVPTQFPELKTFAMTWDNVDIVNPKMSFMQVCEKYGFPIISKEVSDCVHGARKYLNNIKNEDQEIQDVISSLTPREMAQIMNGDKYKKNGSVVRLANLLGMNTRENVYQAKEDISKGERSKFSKEKYNFFLNAPFEISNRCCIVMKEEPAKKYGERTGRKAITAQMADESRQRKIQWLKNGCNGFNMKTPTSNPMSFWTEQDVLKYIYINKLPICSVYGEVVIDYDSMGELEGQVIFDDFNEDIKFKTTGCNRTGCALCAFGSHLESKEDARFLRLKESHPKMYSLLDIIKNNGVTYREAIEWTNEHLRDSQKIPL